MPGCITPHTASVGGSGTATADSLAPMKTTPQQASSGSVPFMHTQPAAFPLLGPSAGLSGVRVEGGLNVQRSGWKICASLREGEHQDFHWKHVINEALGGFNDM